MELCRLTDLLNSTAHNLAALNKSYSASSSVEALGKADQIELLAAARRLVTALEVPEMTILKISKGVFGTFLALMSMCKHSGC